LRSVHFFFDGPHIWHMH